MRLNALPALPPLPSLPPCVSGIDLAEGLRLCDGDASLYRQLLSMLPLVQGGVSEQAQRALAHHDGAQLKRLAHQVCGSCDQIGAFEVAASARRLEAACGDSLAQLRLAVDNFCLCHTALLASLRAWLASDIDRQSQ